MNLSETDYKIETHEIFGDFEIADIFKELEFSENTINVLMNDKNINAVLPFRNTLLLNNCIEEVYIPEIIMNYYFADNGEEDITDITDQLKTFLVKKKMEEVDNIKDLCNRSFDLKFV